MPRFFEELVNNRKDGIAPPQLAQQEPEPDPLPPVEFEHAMEQGWDEPWSDLAERFAVSAMECQRCGALVLSTDRHAAWHALGEA